MNEVDNLAASAQENTESNGANLAAQPDGENSSNAPDPQGTETNAPENQGENGTNEPGDKENPSDQPTGAPEQYEKFALPEDLAYDEGLATEWGELAKGQNLSQEQAQKYVDFYGELQKRSLAEMQKSQQEFSDQLKQETLADPEIGGTKWPEAARNIARARDTFGDEGLTQLIQDNPALGNSSGFLRFLNRVGAAIAEDRVPHGRSVASEKSDAQILFGDMNKEG